MTPSDLETVTWSCVHFATAQQTARVGHGMGSNGLFVARVNGAASSDKGALIKGLCSALNCPDYVGSNWDAIEEAMKDLEWLPRKGYTVVVEGATSLWQRLPREAGLLVEVVLATAESWALNGKPFHLIFEMDEPSKS